MCFVALCGQVMASVSRKTNADCYCSHGQNKQYDKMYILVTD
jgi:hypothetical protein